MFVFVCTFVHLSFYFLELFLFADRNDIPTLLEFVSDKEIRPAFIIFKIACHEISLVTAVGAWQHILSPQNTIFYRIPNTRTMPGTINSYFNTHF